MDRGMADTRTSLRAPAFQCTRAMRYNRNWNVCTETSHLMRPFPLPGFECFPTNHGKSDSMLISNGSYYTLDDHFGTAISVAVRSQSIRGTRIVMQGRLTYRRHHHRLTTKTNSTMKMRLLDPASLGWLFFQTLQQARCEITTNFSERLGSGRIFSSEQKQIGFSLRPLERSG